MPIYEESDHLIRNAKSNLKHVVNHASKPSETFISNEASGDHPDRKAYVRTMELEYEGNESSVASIVGISISQDANLLKEQEIPRIENIHLDADVAQTLMHESGSDPKTQLNTKAAKNARSKHTVPQLFTHATDKRASGACKFTAATISNNDKKHANMNYTESPNLVKNPASLHLESRKPLQPENAKHIDEEDVCSMVSLSTASVKAIKSRTTIASAPTFRVSERAEKWKEFYSKLEQKHQALEAERIEYEARKKEKDEAALKQLRKSLNFKATPMPNFYHVGPSPKAELKKIPATLAKSPKFGRRRKSCGDVYNSSSADSNSEIHCRANRGSLDGAKTANKSQSNIKNGTALCKVEEEKNQEVLKSFEVSESKAKAGNC